MLNVNIIDLFSNVSPLKVLTLSWKALAQIKVPLEHLCGGFSLAARDTEGTWLV